MRKADKIKFELMRYCPNHAWDIVIPNYFVGWYEMDVFKLMQSLFIVEYEIKISRSDFFADFKKDLGAKHVQMQKGRCECNRFYFVVPQNMIRVHEVPSYAGLIYWNGRCFYTVKNAPLLHKRKQPESIYISLAKKLSFRSQLMEQKYRAEVKKRLQKEKEASKTDTSTVLSFKNKKQGALPTDLADSAS